MQPNHVPNAVKRPGDDDVHALTKRSKTEHNCIPAKGEPNDQDGLIPPNRTLARGVERITPYPGPCRPTENFHGWHRRKLVKNVTERLAAEGKRVIGTPRFLDDGVTFDWVADRSVMDVLSNLKNSDTGTMTPMEFDQLSLGPHKTSSDVDIRGQAQIPGLSFYNLGVAHVPSEGIAKDFIRIPNSDDSEEMNVGSFGSVAAGDVVKVVRGLVEESFSDALNGDKAESSTSISVINHANDSASPASTPAAPVYSAHGGTDTFEHPRPEVQSALSSSVYDEEHCQPLSALDTKILEDAGSDSTVATPHSHAQALQQECAISPVDPAPPIVAGGRNFSFSSSSRSPLSTNHRHSPGCSMSMGESGLASDESTLIFNPKITLRAPSALVAGQTRSRKTKFRSTLLLSSKSKEHLSHPLPGRLPTTAANPDTRRSSGGHESLKNVDWTNYKSILFIKGLAWRSAMEDVYEYLRIHGFPFARIKNVQIHSNGFARPMASVQFWNPQDAEEARQALQTSNFLFPALSQDPSSKAEAISIRIEPCQRPKWYLTEASISPAASVLSSSSSTSSGSLGTPVHSSLCSSAAKPAHPASRSVSAMRDPDSRPRQASHISVGEGENASYERVAAPQQPMAGVALQRFRAAASKNDDVDVIELTSDSDEGDDDSDSNASSCSSSSESEFDAESDKDESDRRRSGGAGDERARSVVVAGTTRRRVHVRVPKVKHGRPRRLLLPPNSTNPLMTVTMRGDVQFIHQTSRKRLANLSLPAVAEESRRVEDACLVKETAVIGYSKGDTQASIVEYSNKPRPRAAVIPLPRSPHIQGVFCLAPFISSGALEFLSGGPDKTIKHWRVSQSVTDPDDEEDNGCKKYTTKVQPLGGPLNSAITAVAHHAASQRVLCASGKKLWTLDIEARTEPRAAEFSNVVHQIHVHKKDPNLIIVEVDHLHTQMQMHDVRMDYRDKPRQVFGYTDTSASVGNIRARRRRGDTRGNGFVRGFDDGTICMWDLRKLKETVTISKCEEPVWHTVFAGRKTSNAWAYAGNIVTYIDL